MPAILVYTNNKLQIGTLVSQAIGRMQVSVYDSRTTESRTIAVTKTKRDEVLAKARKNIGCLAREDDLTIAVDARPPVITSRSNTSPKARSAA